MHEELYKNVYFKSDEAKAKWDRMTDEETVLACDILIGRDVEALRELDKKLQNALDKLGDFGKLPDISKEKAFKIAEAVDKYAPQIEEGKLMLSSENQALMDTLFSTVTASAEAKGLTEMGQDIIRDIEELTNLRDRALQAVKGQNKEIITKKGVDRE